MRTLLAVLIAMVVAGVADAVPSQGYSKKGIDVRAIVQLEGSPANGSGTNMAASRVDEQNDATNWPTIPVFNPLSCTMHSFMVGVTGTTTGTETWTRLGGPGKTGYKTALFTFWSDDTEGDCSATVAIDSWNGATAPAHNGIQLGALYTTNVSTGLGRAVYLQQIPEHLKIRITESWATVYASCVACK